MGVLISLSRVIEDDWQRLEVDTPIRAGTRVLVGPQRLRDDWVALKDADIELGVELEATDSIEDFVEYLDRLSLVVLTFEVFADGRAFSQARLLRERLGFTGGIRARGDVLRDQLGFMRRCGFDQFDLADSEEVELALNAFADISRAYQPELKQSNGI